MRGLLLVDLQTDFLDRPGLEPAQEVLLPVVEKLLAVFRRQGLPVFHAITQIGVDGSGSMPHWRDAGVRQCVVGTEGALAPIALRPVIGERVFVKPFFSAFGNADLLPALCIAGVDHLVIAGIYTHACVRTSALDAYQAGLRVTLAQDAVASCEVEHARISLEYLAARAVTVERVAQIVASLTANPGSMEAPRWTQRNPSDWDEVLDRISLDGEEQVAAAIERALDRQPSWQKHELAARRAHLQRWAQIIASRRTEFIALMAREIGKPPAPAHGEVDYALTLLHHCLSQNDEEQSGPDARVRYRPHGVIGVITPWNNPLAIAVGKLTPALYFGNTVVWKPALQSNALNNLLLHCLGEAGLGDCVQMVRGAAATGQWLARLPGIAAVSVTGSTQTGRALAQHCAATQRPLQAELGGNNAVLVMADADLEHAALDLAQACFSFSGQRCTAPRRIIVEQRVKAQFEALLTAAVRALPVGAVHDPATVLGPVISRHKQQALLAAIEAAQASGAHLLCGGTIPPGLEAGCWLTPTLLSGLAPDAPLVREESFGPLVIIQGAEGIEEAVNLCNVVEQGLVASLLSKNPQTQQYFLAHACAGMLSLNRARPPFAAHAPFPGWKASGFGLAEHGRWARDFYTRVQTIYRSEQE